MTLSTLRVLSIPENTDGRDFIIGDLHGHLDMLQALLSRENFDANKDRVISVGDLVDRGPSSRDCLALTQKPWFFAVEGNHERHLHGLATLAKRVVKNNTDLGELAELLPKLSQGMGSQWFADWIATSPSLADIEDMLTQCESLPHVIIVRGKFPFNVVHSELHAAKLRSDTDLVDGRTLSKKEFESTQWSRTLFKEHEKKHATTKPHSKLFANLDAGLSMTFVGHNVTPSPFVWRNHFFLDTGCGFTNPELAEVLGLTAFITNDFRTARITHADLL